MPLTRDFKETIRARAQRNPCRFINRHGQHETVIVIGMFANEIDASGRADDVDFSTGAKERLELVLQIGNIRLHGGEILGRTKKSAIHK